ncbi:MAG: SpoVR family protein [Myxococcota bacterium]
MVKFALKTALPAYLRDEQARVEAFVREFGLDFFPVIFEMLSYDQMNEVASYGGFPTRYPHWRFGMEYERLSKSYEYGLSKIYEMVINNNPSIAYLLEGNSLVEQKLVMSHVYAHVDFFKNNFYFRATNQGTDFETGEPIRKWIDTMANHGAIVRRWANRIGIDKVEELLDRCLSIENLIDPQLPFQPPARPTADDEEVEETPELRLLRVDRDYMESFINPEEFVEAQKRKIEEEKQQAKKFPEHPRRDILGFLIEHAPLERWERELLGIIRREAYYFLPQMQTKILNEGWACVAPDTLVFTEQGLLPMAEVVAGQASEVSDGEERRGVYDRNIIRDHATTTVRTRRGLELTGSNNHRVLLADGETWKRLDALEPGDRIHISGGDDMWPTRNVPLTWSPPRRVSLEDVAEEASVSVWTVLRHRAGKRVRATEAVASALEAYEAEENAALPMAVRKRRAVKIPSELTSELGAFIGYLVGDGHISRKKRHLGLTTGDDEQAAAFVRLAERLFEVPASMRRDGGRWRVLVHSETVSDFLVQALGLCVGRSARVKSVPALVLQSPEPVVRAFLRAYFDCDGYAGKHGVILSTSSEALGRQVQLLLLNYGILSRRRRNTDGWHVQVAGTSASHFSERIGFGLGRKQAALDAYVRERRWFKRERWEDEIVSLEAGRGDVYDISVEETHRYAAAGFVNHNSYWHSKLMTEKVCDASEIVDYADRNASVLSVSGGRLNPYKLGVELYRHIEERWNRGQFGKEWEECDDMEARRAWDRRTGLGREKIFEVRALYNDVTFIDEFLTPDFVIDNKMFSFGFNNRSDRWEIESREFDEVKNKLLFQLTNAGNPVVFVEDANYGNRGELLLWHDHQGIDLRLDWAQETLAALERLWKRPVELHTVLEGKPTLLRFDGAEHVQRGM